MPRLNLEHQRKRARALLKAARANDPDALRRFQTHARPTAATTVSLHDAQLVVARENGFTGWARLKEHIRSESMRHPHMLSALVAAANRALETERAQPLYRDQFARPLAGRIGWSVFEAMQRASWPGFATGPDPYLTVMTRFFDDALQRVVSESAITQVIVLNAGMDTRAFRLGWAHPVTLFEVDTTEVFEHKQAVLDERRARPTCRRHIVAADPHGSCTRALLKAGFDARSRTAVLVERMHYYEAEEADRLLRELTTLLSPGSWIGLALTSEETRRSVFMTPYLQKMEALGFPPWRFGVDDPEAWLATCGWQATSVVAGAPEASYGRWPYAYIPRETPAIPRAFFTQGRLGGRAAGLL